MAYLPAKLRMIAGHGDWAVKLFMIVSGFVITHLLLCKKEEYGPYITRRFFRLMPLFLATMAIAILLRAPYETAWAHNLWVAGREMRAERIALENAYLLEHLLLHLTMLHGAVPDSLFRFANSSFLAPAWSLSLEWQFYLLAPLILWAMRGGFAGTLVMVAGLVLSGMALDGWFGSWRYPSFIFLSLPLFLIGMASRLLIEARGRWQAVLWLLAGLAMLFVWWKGTWIGLALIPAVWIFFLAISIWQERGGKGPRWLAALSWLLATNPLTLMLGRISFSTYIAHVPILSLIVGGGLMLTGRTDHATVILLTILAFPATLAGSILLYRYVELPGLAFGRRFAAGGGVMIGSAPIRAEQS